MCVIVMERANIALVRCLFRGGGLTFSALDCHLICYYMDMT
jgi:hypothetical protein